MNQLEQCIKDVNLFNEFGSNYNNVTEYKLHAQADVVRKEVIELSNAFWLAEGNEQILKECVDVLVTITGFVGMLERLGFDVMGAWNKVNENNLTKFPRSEATAIIGVEELKAQGVNCGFTYNDKHKVYIIKDEAGKIRKSAGYEKCSVAEFCPKEN